MGRVAGLIQEALPGTFVHSIQIGDNPDNDANAGFFGNINEQVSQLDHQRVIFLCRGKKLMCSDYCVTAGEGLQRFGRNT